MSGSIDNSMASTTAVRLLRTKLFVPQAHPELVSRLHLLRRLDESKTHKLTLISAPAGFGKTTLLSAWAAGVDVAVAWVSLDERDSDPTRFWTYVVAALQTVWPGIGVASHAMLQSPQTPPIEGVLVELLNEVSEQESPAVLVLDDYHVISESEIHRGIGFLLDHLPVQVSVILSGREDPPLPLPLLRARRQLLEIRAPDLRFTAEEVDIFLNRVMGLALQDQDVAILESLTEGWAAGLQLAALSLQEVNDVGAYVASFSGGHRYVFDYLAEEILNRQPPELREFLLKTSLLTRMSGALCDAVVDGKGSQAMLERLEKANLFITPLDPERRWYRYHPLFVGFLRARLSNELTPAATADLHGRASTWYAAHNALPEAVDHALAGKDYAGAMALIKSEVFEMFRRSELRTLLAWLSELPHESIRQDGFLSMAAAWALLALGRGDAVEPHLKDVERLIDARADGSPESFEREPEIRGILGEISCLQASLAFNTMDFAKVQDLCDRTRRYLDAPAGSRDVEVPGGLFNDRASLLGVTAFNLAITQMYSGETRAALETFSAAIDLTRRDENPHLLPMCMSYRAQLQLLRGNLRGAADSYQEAAREIEGTRVRSPLSGMAYTGLGWVYYEWNDLNRAAALLQQGVELGTQWSHWEILLSGYSGLAHIDRARGDFDGAARRLQDLSEMLTRTDMEWGQSGVEAHRALLALRQGDLATARAWGDTVMLPGTGPVPYVLEPYALILSRVYLAQGKPDCALQLLDRIVTGAEVGGRTSRVIEARVVRALVLDAQHNRPAALVCLARALELAGSEGYVRTFIDEGPPVLALLGELAGRSAYAARLLTAAGTKEETLVSPTLATREPRVPQPAAVAPLAEPLTRRELEILALMARGMTNQEIADHLVLSINTVKTHAKNVYDKLGVRNRAQATLRATELDLL